MVWVSIAAKRADQLNQIKDVISKLEARLLESERCLKELALLDSISSGLYEELEVLVKVGPVEPVTPLILGQINQFVCEVKRVMPFDRYIQNLEPLVGFGSGPQQRDGVVLVRQARQGLERFGATLTPHRARLADHLSQARVVQSALEITIRKRGEPVYRKEIEAAWCQANPAATKKVTTGFYQKVAAVRGITTGQDGWFIDCGYAQCHFDFDKLDALDIPKHFLSN